LGSGASVAVSLFWVMLYPDGGRGKVPFPGLMTGDSGDTRA
jgi:hypothetical protein